MINELIQELIRQTIEPKLKYPDNISWNDLFRDLNTIPKDLSIWETPKLTLMVYESTRRIAYNYLKRENLPEYIENYQCQETRFIFPEITQKITLKTYYP